MAETEQIPILKGQEQDVEILYGTRRLKFEFRYNGVSEYWYIHRISDTEDDSTIVEGLKIALGLDVFAGLSYLLLGRMTLIDSDPTNSDAIDMFADFGDRLQLYRFY